MTNLVGTTLGQYQIVELIGEGGMANVYKAWQPSLRRYVALKVLAPHLADDAEFVQRFHQEAVSAANLKHTNIVTIHDVGTESGYNYIAMEFIEGASLEERIRSGQAFSLEQVADVITQVGSALDYAHQRGFIHRDIKPANILIDPSGRAVLTDFGIVKALSGSGVTSPLTRAGTVFGTPHYMSPEQVRDEPLDHRSDLYSLGIVCYEMLSGQVPFDGATTHAILYAQVNTPPPPLRDVAGLAVPPPVEAVVNKMLAKERGNRYNSAGGFARDMAQAVSGIWPAGISGATVVAAPMGTGTAVMEPTPAGTPAATVPQPMPAPYTPAAYTPTPPPVAAPARRRRWPVVLGVVVVVAGVLLILGAVVGWLMFSPWYPLKSGQSALADGDYAGAVEGFSQALERDTDNVEAIEGLLEAADNLAQAGQLDDAITAYETVRGVKPGEVQALRGLGQVYEAKGELGEAAGWYEKWTQATPEEGSAFLALGSARFNLGEYEGAVVAYEQAKALGAGAAEMDTHLGLAYYELAQYDKAVEHLQNAVGQTPEDFELQRALGVSLYDQDQLERALEHLNKAVALGADRPGDELLDVYYALGGCHFGVQDYEQAVSFYRQAQELDPEGQAIWAGEARANLDEAYSKLALDVMGSAMFDLDFSNIATEEGETYAIAKTGQMVKIEGAVHLVDGPWEGSQALVVEEDTANRCPNPSAETGVVGYATQYSGVPEVKVSQETGFGLFGAKCIRIASSDASAYVWNSPHAHAPASSNSTWHDGRTRAISAWVLGTGTWRVVFENSGQHLGAYTEVALASTWQRVEVTATNSSGIDYSSYRMSFFPMSSGNTELYVDGVQYEEKGHATTYCDGDQGDGYSWSRTPHAGVSSRQATTLNLDDHVNLISGNDALSFRVRAQMPYSYDAPWHVTYPIMFDARGADNDNRILLGYHTVDDVFYLFVNGSTKATKSLSFSAGDWIDFIGTLDFSGDSYSLYVNGELAGTDSASLTVPTLTSWRIGSTYNGTSIGNYAISESVVFDRALTVNEVEALYRVGTFASR